MSSYNSTTTRKSTTKSKTKRIWHVHTTDHYSAIKMNEHLIHATEYVNFENTLLSKMSQIQRTAIIWFHLYKIPNKQTHKERRYNRSYQGLREGEVGVVVP